MNDAGHTAVSPFPARLATAALLLTVCVLAALSWSAFDTYRDSVAVQTRDLRLTELRGMIVHLDEVLTMSARMCATTGDQQWERRYREFEPTLDAAVEETMKLTIQSASEEAAAQTDAANLKLVAMENQAFALVRAGRPLEARDVLFSAEYEKQKKIYAAGTATLIDDIKAGLAASQNRMWRRSLLFGASAMIASGLLALVWFKALARLKEWRGALSETVAALRRGTSEMQAEVRERKLTENKLIESEARLAAAQIIARIGSWEWDVPANQITWSDENYRIHGFAPGEFELSYASALSCVHPADRERSEVTIKGALQDGRAFNFEHRIVKGDGNERTIQQRGEVVLRPDGGVAKVIGTAQDVSELKHAEEELKRAHEQLLGTSRKAGMAEVATGVLHNVGNVLNSVNVSTCIMRNTLRRSESPTLTRVAALLREHDGDFDEFLTKSPKGRMLPKLVIQLADQLEKEHATLLAEQEHISRNVEHIKSIVAVQQDFASVSGVLEKVRLADLLGDALQMHSAGFARHGIEVERDYADLPAMVLDKHKVVQILVNLVTNAKHAIEDSRRNGGRIQVSLQMAGTNRVRISVTDNGVGIPAENLTRIFSHGFTTRHDGHGFGLHSGAIAAHEMGGSLSVQSDGPGLGATFTLEIPIRFNGSS